MQTIKKLAIFIGLFYIVSQAFLNILIPVDLIYNKRLNYDVFKDNVYAIETTVKAIKAEIHRENIKEYILFIGDSVGYGTPCPPEKTMSSFMNELAFQENSNIRVFNLCIPSSMFGDFYSVILLLNKYNISTENLILSFSYWEISAKTPSYWLRHYLKDLDKRSYNDMVLSGHIKQESAISNFKSEIYHLINTNISIIGYSGFINNKIKTVTNNALNQSNPVLQVWSQKPKLTRTLNLPENRWYYSDKEFNLSNSSPQIYFINKIAEIQKGKNTIVFMNAMNKELLSEATAKEGFNNNIKAINKFFADKGLNYIDYNDKVDYSFFSDHVHLLPEGYKFMAQDLWERINQHKEK